MKLPRSKHVRPARVKRIPLEPPASPFYAHVAANADLRAMAFGIARAYDQASVRAMQRALALSLVEFHLKNAPERCNGMMVPSIGNVLDVAREIADRREPTDALVIQIAPYLAG